MLEGGAGKRESSSNLARRDEVERISSERAAMAFTTECVRIDG